MNWKPPEKPGELTESRLISAILDNHFPPGSNLPGERELAVQFGVTRPTLREVLQRLERDGWLEIRQGKPTRVRNYWQEGNLAVLVAVAMYQGELPPDFVPNLMAVRILMAPAYTRLAIERDWASVASVLENPPALEDTAQTLLVMTGMFTGKWRFCPKTPCSPCSSTVSGSFIMWSGRCISPIQRRVLIRFSIIGRSWTAPAGKTAVAAQLLTEQIMRESLDLWQQHASARQQA
jgi:hypothetical protein